MSNGNLLNNLLGITSANPAVSKATAAKARAESSEKFQQALEQVRPEVAARKPIARKETPAEAAINARSNSKPAVQRDSSHEVTKTDARPKARENTQEPSAKTGEKTDVPAGDKCANEPVAAGASKQQSTNSDNQQAGDTPTAGEQNQEASDVAVVAIDVLLSANAAPDEVEAEATLPETLLGLTTDTVTQLPVTDEAANEAVVSGESLDPAQDSEGVIVLDPSLLGLKAEAAPIVGSLPGDVADASLAPLTVSTPQTTAGISASLTDARLLTGQANATPLGQSIGDALAVTDAAITGEVDALVDAESNGSENPDFLLLNSKAALNKLAETTMTDPALDKTTVGADILKSAPVSTVVEGLARLTEAQSPSARAFVVQTGVPVPVGSPQWSQAVGDKVLWLAAQNVSAAEIRLDPPELGPMQVKVTVNQDQASVTFTSPHPAVREALDQQLNRLREMFSEQGLNLVNVDVSDKSFTQREQDEHSTKHQANTDGDEEEAVPVAVSQAISMRLVDHYA